MWLLNEKTLQSLHPVGRPPDAKSIAASSSHLASKIAETSKLTDIEHSIDNNGIKEKGASC